MSTKILHHRLLLTVLAAAMPAIALETAARAEVAPLHHWTFDEAAWSGLELKSKAGPDAKALKEPSLESGAMLFEGDTRVDIPGVTPDALPTASLTAEAWIAIDQGQEWGNAIGYFQDNGNYERGWSLGYDASKFMFWLSTGGSLVKVASTTSFETGQWYHVAASYDGREMRLYVNGVLEAAVDKATGPIAYPEKAFYTMGAYRDDNELYPMFGKLREVRVFDKVVPESELKARAGDAKTQADVKGLTYAVRPALKFIGPNLAQVTWETTEEGAGAVNLGTTRKLGKLVPAKRDGTKMHAFLEGLEPNTQYYYKIGGMRDKRRIMSPAYEFNTSMNFTVASIMPWMEASPRTRDMLTAARASKGYAVVLGSSSVAIEIGTLSEMSVFVFDSDPERVEALRLRLLKDGAYGHRISASVVDDYANLPVTSCFANIVVAPEGSDPAEIERILTPGSGKGFLVDDRGDVTGVIERAPLKDAGKWTHQYGDAGNTTNAGESLGGASATDDLTLQWIGRPGGDFGIDRQSRMPAPLAVGGRLYHQGMSRLVALDAYNGSVLWGLEIPDLRRLNMPKDASNWCADEDHLYLAVEERAWILDGRSGDSLATLTPPPIKSGQAMNWGYIARAADKLFGSSTKPKSVYTRYWGGEAWFDGKEGEGTGKVCSDNFFAYDLNDRRVAWTYENGVILNPTIAIGGGHVYFVECRHPKIKRLENRQIGEAELWQDQFLVALDAETGQTLWERPIDTVDGVTSFYLQYSPLGVVVTASNKQFYLYSFNPESGEPEWEKSSPWPNDHHSGHIQHPVIVGDTIYLQPNGHSMITGETVTKKVGERSGCTTYIGVKDALIYRGQGRQVAMWDLEKETVTAWDRLRPSCWLSVIAAEGMVLVPEGGGGCSCGGWMETSLVLAPRSLVVKPEGGAK